MVVLVGLVLGVRGDLCEMTSCLRKCCPGGQFLSNRTCQKTENQLDFSGLGVELDAPIQDGVVKCDESQSRFLLDGTDGFYIEDNNLVWPLLNLTTSYVFYCVDMIDDFDAAKALLCYGGAPDDNIVHFCSGKIAFQIADFNSSARRFVLMH